MVCILLCDGVEEIEAIVPYDLLVRAGVSVQYLGVSQMLVTGGQGTKLMAHGLLAQTDLSACEMIVLPGGRGGVERLLESPLVHEAVMQVWNQGGFVAAICAAPVVLARLGLTAGKRATCYPDQYWRGKMEGALLEDGAGVVTDGRLITGLSAGQSIPFGLKLIDVLQGIDKAQAVAKAIVFGVSPESLGEFGGLM